MALKVEDYSLFEHRHRFAVWTGARASQRGFTTTQKLRVALEISGVVEVLRGDPGEWPSSSTEVDKQHRQWSRNIVAALEQAGVRSVSYGRAAKLLNVYLKTMVVVGEDHGTTFARVLHPPIDSFLLKGLRSDPQFRRDPARTLWRTPWTSWDESSYFAAIDSFRRLGLDQPAFWQIERYWQPDRGEALARIHRRSGLRGL